MADYVTLLCRKCGVDFVVVIPRALSSGKSDTNSIRTKCKCGYRFSVDVLRAGSKWKVARGGTVKQHASEHKPPILRW